MINKLKDIKVYYSGAIKGTPEPDPEFAWKLVNYMSEQGIDVLSEHVASRTEEEKNRLMSKRIGKTVAEFQSDPEPWFGVRRQDVKWVEEATHVVALVNGPSLGVGMEVEHALLKPKLGMNKTPILCLVREDILPKLSYMIRGVTSDESEMFQIKTYNTLEEAQEHILEFLSK